MENQLVVFEIQTFKNLMIWGKRGFLPKFKPPISLNYWVNFNKIGVILKEIAHKCHFCNKILLLSKFNLTFDLVGHMTNCFLNMEIK